MVHMRKENVLLNTNVNLVYKKIDAEEQEDLKILKTILLRFYISKNKGNKFCHLNLDIDM